MTYKLLADGTIQRIEDTAFIPKDAGNRDYRDYLAWVAAGHVPPQDAPLQPTLQQQLAATNDSLLQITGQVISVLVKKGLLTTADVPLSAQAVLSQRQAILSQLGAN